VNRKKWVRPQILTEGGRDEKEAMARSIVFEYAGAYDHVMDGVTGKR